jgi:predicted nucleotide-binding protein
MFFHVFVFNYFNPVERQRGKPFHFRNLDEEQLKSRVVDRWNQGTQITWGGDTADSTGGALIKIFRTTDAISGDTNVATLPPEFEVTNDWITGPAGALASAEAAASDQSGRESPLRDHRRVMVVYGRNLRARDAMFTFLRALGLSPIEWEEAVAETGVASPHNLDAVRAAMDVGQAVVVILTAEDRAGLLPELADGQEDEMILSGQPRQNVILEAGLAMGVDRSRTILVELGPIRRASDFDGLNAVRLSNAPASRGALRSRLQSAGCDINESAADWMRPEVAGDFESAVVEWDAVSANEQPQ